MKTTRKKIKFYVALQGNRKPKDYIHLAKAIEKMGYDRIYVYDDLMFYSSTQILTLIAEHTEKIELGPCLLNGIYRHPAIISQEAVFLNEISKKRSVLGMGRGAFFDFYNLKESENHTRELAEETIMQVKRLLNNQKEVLSGKYFKATEKAFLRIENIDNKIPIVVGTWNEKMAEIAGEHAEELQTANVWNMEYLKKLKTSLIIGAARSVSSSDKKISIGGMACISNNTEKAYLEAKKTISVYIPYLSKLLEKQGFDVQNEYFTNLFNYSKHGNYQMCCEMLTNEVVDSISLVGTPENIVNKIENIRQNIEIEGIMFSPPYGIESIEENLEFLMENVVKKINSESIENKKVGLK